MNITSRGKAGQFSKPSAPYIAFEPYENNGEVCCSRLLDMHSLAKSLEQIIALSAWKMVAMFSMIIRWNCTFNFSLFCLLVTFCAVDWVHLSLFTRGVSDPFQMLIYLRMHLTHSLASLQVCVQALFPLTQTVTLLESPPVSVIHHWEFPFSERCVL